ncbi:COP1-interacting protein 7 [Prunus dulcis]|uniref:COP1-interacting protein 7 n=1 Tax=Prunus dulcis TaxID=3755 RepID=A0A4Y1R9E4_PRUDU|nr:COP1-interacting protein 7 [Prunus dulcis]
MDSGARLDYALFQLTPTRTRCDLVIFYGGKSEKLASGLFQPFVSHLKSVKDEISRGGYSITLRPPTPHAPWFTKSTFQRFVRFVSTPAVLERFVSIEREILQIESSVQLEEGVVSADRSTRKPTDSLKKRGELEETEDVAENENSKVRLQRILETRIALLRKQQAMAYARGLVAGFEIHNIDDLISFSDAFGASRLREACINFREVYKKKHTDGLFMEELAAMVASSPDLQFTGASGITLTNETDVTNQNVMLNLPNAGVPTGEKVQAPMPFPNQIPQYFYSSLGHTNQLPPYHGYPFPTMQSFPPHYPRNLQWPPNMEEASFRMEPNYHRVQKSSSRRRKNSSNKKDLNIQGKANKLSPATPLLRKSSRKVVIQNINYITPKRRDGYKGGVSDESFSDEEFDDENSLKQKSDKAEVLEISHESNVDKSHCILNGSSSEDLSVNTDEHFLARSEGGNSLAGRPTLGLDLERIPKKLTAGAAVDPLVVMERNERNDYTVKLEDFQNEESFGSVMERKDCEDRDILFLQRSEKSGADIRCAFSASAAESTITKSSRSEDWFVVNHSENTENSRIPILQTISDGDCIFALERKDMGVDDSFFIQTRSASDDMYESPWKTEINMDNNLSLAAKKENGTIDNAQDKQGAPKTSEPDDLSMILERVSNLESTAISWSMDYGAEISFPEANRRSSGVETTDVVDKKLASNGMKNNKSPGTKDGGKEARSNFVRKPLNNRIDFKSNKASPARRPMIQKSKLEKEEEIRKKMEELRIERQKRIAEKTAAVAPKRVPLESKTAKGSIKSDKSKLQSTKRTLHL